MAAVEDIELYHEGRFSMENLTEPRPFLCLNTPDIRP